MNGFMSSRTGYFPENPRSRWIITLSTWSLLGGISWASLQAQEAEAPLAPPALVDETIPAELFATETEPQPEKTVPAEPPAKPQPTKRPGNARLLPTGPDEKAPARPQSGKFGETTELIPTEFKSTQTLIRKRSAPPSNSVWAVPQEPELTPTRPIHQVQNLVPGEGLGEPAAEGEELMLETPPAIDAEALTDEPVLREPAPNEPANFTADDAAPVPADDSLDARPVRTNSENQVRIAPAPYADSGEGQFSSSDELHTVAGGESFWTISKKHYGQGRYSAALAEYNKVRIPKPDKIKPGMKVVVPSIDTLEAKFAHLISGAVTRRTAAAPTVPVKSGFFVDANGQPMYRVGEGDTLSDIAQNHLGRSSRWTQIVTLNEDTLPNPDNMKIGMVLRLPEDASDSIVVR